MYYYNDRELMLKRKVSWIPNKDFLLPYMEISVRYIDQNAYTKIGDLIMDQIVMPIPAVITWYYPNYCSTCVQIEKLRMLLSRPINKCLSKSPSV